MASVTCTVKGNVAHFRNIVSEPLTSLKVYFTPVMQGSGEQSPTNVRMFSPIMQVTAYHCGKNLFDASAVVRRDEYILDDNGAETSSNASGYLKNLTQVAENETYTISGTIAIDGYAWRIYFYDINSNFISRTSSITKSPPYTFKTPNGCKYITIQYNFSKVDFNSIQIEHSYNATEYMPYSCITETLSVDNNVEVYGGYVDLITGQVVATHKVVMLNDPDKWKAASDSGIYGAGNVTWYYDETFSDRYKDGNSSYTNADCSYSPLVWNTTPIYVRWTAASSDYIGFTKKGTSDNTLDTVKAAAQRGEIQLCYLLAQPQYVGQISTFPTINTFSGHNSIWTDMGGEIEVTYNVQDTAEIAAKRFMIMSQPHKETVSSTGLINFKTDMGALALTNLTSGTTVKIIGKNIYDEETYPLTADYYIMGSSGREYNDSTNYMATLDYIPVEQYRGCMMVLNHRSGGGYVGIAFYNASKAMVYGNSNDGITAGEPIIFCVPPEATYMRFTVPANTTDAQIELGVISTNYEPYVERSVIVDTNQKIKTLKGVNNIYSNGVNLAIDYWTHSKNPPKTIGGLPVLIDNYAYNGGNARVDGEVTYNTDYFIAGPFDTGNNDSKSYNLTSPSSAYLRFYKNLSSSSYDWWTYNTRTISCQGRFIIFSAKKSVAGSYAVYDNTNSRYIAKGDNVT